MKNIIFAILISISTLANAQCPTVQFTTEIQHKIFGNVLVVHTHSIELPTTVPYGTPYVQYGLTFNGDNQTYVRLNSFDSLLTDTSRVFWIFTTADTLVLTAELIYMTYDSNNVLQASEVFFPCLQFDTIILNNNTTGIEETATPTAINKIYAYEKTITIESETKVKSYTVYDMTGRAVISNDVNESGTIKINTSLPTGIYIVSATTEAETQINTRVPIQ